MKTILAVLILFTAAAASASAQATISNDGRGVQIARSASQKVAFHGAKPVIQRAGAAQVAVATTAPTNTTPYGFSQAQAAQIIALLNELRAAMVEKGLIKGAP